MRSASLLFAACNGAHKTRSSLWCCERPEIEWKTRQWMLQQMWAPSSFFAHFSIICLLSAVCTGNPPQPANGVFSCGTPVASKNGQAGLRVTAVNRDCTARCAPGAVGSPKSTCTAQGKWSPVVGACTGETNGVLTNPINKENESAFVMIFLSNIFVVFCYCFICC